MKILPTELIKFIRDTETQIPKSNISNKQFLKSFLLSFRSVLTLYDKMPSSVSGVSDSISKVTFDTSVYDDLLNDQPNNEAVIALKTYLLNVKYFTKIHNYYEDLSKLSAPSNFTESVTKRTFLLTILYTIFLLSIQLNTKTLEYTNIRLVAKLAKQLGKTIDTKLNQTATIDDITSSIQFKGLLRYNKSLKQA